ncbi:MAG TPA: hypothetical protein DIW23_04250 [Anaerolineae bacterium]|nr:hypothetical protein [Anaerolineae bacterium]
MIKNTAKKFLSLFLFIVFVLNMLILKTANAYSLSDERPIFLAWPLPSYIGVARISQFPNTPWTWNYLGLNSGMQCPPAFGYLEAWMPTWRDTSIPWEQDVAQADPHQFQMIECYSAGGEVGKNGHEATDIKAPATTPVFASADGKIAGWRIWDINTMLVLKHCLGGTWNINNECQNGTKWYTTYMHIVIEPAMQQMDLDISTGTQLGTIYPQGDNSHLHFEVGLDKRDYANYVNPWGRDESPWLGCMWIDQTLCVIPNPVLNQTLFQAESGQVFLKKFFGPFVLLPKLENVIEYKVIENRIGALTEDNTFWLLENSKWTKIDENVIEFQITNSRIAILSKDNILRVQNGDWKNEWDMEVSEVQNFYISSNRVGALSSSGELYIIENDLKNQWSIVAQGVSGFQLSDTRIAYINLLGDLMVQEGVLTSEWKTMLSNVKAFQLSGVRVAALNKDNQLWVNHGNLRAEFVLQAENVELFQLADNRILILQQDGTWKVKQGSLYDSWISVSYISSKKIILNGNLPTFVD